jgi:hypothetical protein
MRTFIFLEGSKMRSGSRRRVPRISIALFYAFLMAGFGPASASAQLLGEGRLVATPQMGIAMPMGDISDYLAKGPSFGLQMKYRLAPRFSVGLETAFDSHEGVATGYTLFVGPPTQVLRYGLTAELDLLPPNPGSLTISAGGGVGLATMLSEPMFNQDVHAGEFAGGPGTTLDDEGVSTHAPVPIEFKGTYPAFSGLLRIGYVANSRITLFAEGTGFYSRVDEDKTAVFVQQEIGPGGPFPYADVGPDGTIVFIRKGPLEAPTTFSSIGVRLGFQWVLDQN